MNITKEMIEQQASKTELYEDGYKGFISGAEWVLSLIEANETNTLLAVSGFDWNQYRSTIWLANAHVNDERFLKPEKVGVLVADIKKLLHIIHEAQEAACASGAMDKTVSDGSCLKSCSPSDWQTKCKENGCNTD